MTDLANIAINRDRHAPATARRAVERFAPSLHPSVLADVTLLVSELITNAVKYGRGEVVLAMRSDHDRHVHVEVVDEGPGFVPVARERSVNEFGGWGLQAVETLADRWGVHGGSTHVWFEIERR
jgi:anti-sigma regulatory factor (Ser/Thr protein kinase)